MFHKVKCTAPSDPAIPPCRDLAFRAVTSFCLRHQDTSHPNHSLSVFKAHTLDAIKIG